MTITRRQLAHGTLWSAPVILASAAAPVMAVSPCALYKPGGTLPASAFTLMYMSLNLEYRGLVFDKHIALKFGFRISDEARACGVRNTLFTSGSGSGVSRAIGEQYVVHADPERIRSCQRQRWDCKCRVPVRNFRHRGLQQCSRQVSLHTQKFSGYCIAR